MRKLFLHVELLVDPRFVGLSMKVINNAHIHHAKCEHGSERVIASMPVDGFDSSTNPVYQFDGCFWPGSPKHTQDNPESQKKFEKLRNKMKRSKKLVITSLQFGNVKRHTRLNNFLILIQNVIMSSIRMLLFMIWRPILTGQKCSHLLQNLCWKINLYLFQFLLVTLKEYYTNTHL